jgi:hypothetical protein
MKLNQKNIPAVSAAPGFMPTRSAGRPSGCWGNPVADSKRHLAEPRGKMETGSSGLARRGFVAMFSFVILLIGAIFGFTYWNISRLSTDQIVKEAHRIKARNLAQAGIEKVMINTMNQYQMGNMNLDYPTKFTTNVFQKEYERELGDGKYKVELVKIYTPPGTDKPLSNVPYHKNRVLIGFYDVWQVVVIGEVAESKVTARVETLIKIIRRSVQY